MIVARTSTNLGNRTMLQAISIFPLLAFCLLGQKTDAERIQAYVSRPEESRISSVEVTHEGVKIHGKSGSGASLLEVPFHENGWGKLNPSHIHPIKPDSQGNFSISLPRKVQGNDRIYRKWMLANKEGDGWQPLTHSHYALSLIHI